MVNVAVVEDNAEDRARLIRHLNEAAAENGVLFQIDEYANANAFLLNFQSQFQIVFMDIEMPNLDGITAAQKLREIDSKAILVFTTNMAQMAIRGYEVAALDFMLKPLAKEAFLLKMRRILRHVKVDSDNHILINHDGIIHNISADSILYIEIDGHYIVYHTKETDYREYSSFGAAMKKLNAGYFQKCNRGTTVNLFHVEAIYQNSLQVDGRTFPISRSLRKEFMTNYLKFIGGNHV